MAHKNIWDQPDYPWGQDLNRDLLKQEYDRRLAREQGLVRSRQTPLANDPKSSAMVDQLMKRQEFLQKNIPQQRNQTPLNFGHQNDSNNSMNFIFTTDTANDNAQSRIQNDRPRIDPARFELSENLDAFMRDKEELMLDYYEDSGNVPTIGLGHKVDDGQYKEGDTITVEQAEKHFTEDKEEARKYALKLVGNLPMYRYEFEAIVDLMYNVGPGNLGIGIDNKKSPLLNAAIKAGDYNAIGNNLIYTIDNEGNRQDGLAIRSDERTKRFLGNF